MDRYWKEGRYWGRSDSRDGAPYEPDYGYYVIYGDCIDDRYRTAFYYGYYDGYWGREKGIR